ncbi:MAG TPA: SRPBCC family protein [Burkholderiaceae bacterium]|nr:SRPBCC family protein [Burkholderiaceae bacterium]
MGFILRAIGALVLVALLLLGVGFLLPGSYRIERSVEITAPATRVYPLIADPREWKRWSAWNRRDPAMLIDYSGPASGAGAAWSWRSRSEGNGRMEFTEAVADQRVAYALSFADDSMRSHGSLTLDAQGNRVRVAWTNEGDLGRNPAARWFGLFMDRIVGPDFEAGLRNLKSIVEGG